MVIISRHPTGVDEMQDLATHPLMRAAKVKFVACHVAAMDGAMTAADARSDAEEAFDQMLPLYFVEAANFDPTGPYIDAVEHGGNECLGSTDLERDALDAIGEVHFNISREKPEIKEAA